MSEPQCRSCGKIAVWKAGAACKICRSKSSLAASSCSDQGGIYDAPDNPMGFIGSSERPTEDSRRVMELLASADALLDVDLEQNDKEQEL
jgi:hypothetical protein